MALQEAWLPQGAEAWARLGKSRRGARPTQQGVHASSPTTLQARIRICFQKCTDAWRNIPWSRLPDDPCEDRLTKTEWWELHQQAGVPCGYYDYYIRICQQHCLQTGCIPEEAYCFVWDPDNPDFFPQGEDTPISIIGGVPPLSWQISGDGFSIPYPQTQTGSNVLSLTASACGTGTIIVTDSCGRQITEYPKSQQGQYCICYDMGTGGTPNYCGPPIVRRPWGPLFLTYKCAYNGGVSGVSFSCVPNCGILPGPHQQRKVEIGRAHV